MLRPAGLDLLLIAVILALIALVIVWWWYARTRHIKIAEPDYIPPPSPTLARGSAGVPPPSPSPAPAPAPTPAPAPASSASSPGPAPVAAFVPTPGTTGADETKDEGTEHQVADTHLSPALVVSPTPVLSPAPSADDLELIKGVGPKIVTLLATQGITRFAQIAAWTEADVARMAPVLGNFAGRVDREHWIEQARLLAAGDFAAFEARFGRIER